MFKGSRFLLQTVRSGVEQEVLVDLKRGEMRGKVMIRNDCADSALNSFEESNYNLLSALLPLRALSIPQNTFLAKLLG